MNRLIAILVIIFIVVGCSQLEPTATTIPLSDVLSTANALVEKAPNVATQAAARSTLTAATITAQEAIRATQQAGQLCTDRVRKHVGEGNYSDFVPNANLSGCDLRGLDLFGLDLSNVDLSLANLSGTNLQNTVLNGANLNGTILNDANLSNASLEAIEINSEAYLYRTNFSNADLTRNDLSGIDLRNAIISGADFRDTTLTGAFIDVSFLKDATFDTESLNSANLVISGTGWEKWALSWSPDSTSLAIGGHSGDVQIWDIQSLKLNKSLPVGGYYVWDVPWSPNGKLLAIASHDDCSGCFGSVEIWSIGGRLMTTIQGTHPDGARSVAWNPDSNRLATISVGGLLRIWDVDTGSNLISIGEVGDGYNSDADVDIDWSPSGKFIASANGSWDTVSIWDSNTGRGIANYHNQGGVVNVVSWSPDEKYLATSGSSGLVVIWDIETGNPKVLLEHENNVSSVAWSPDGKILISGSSDGDVRLWNSDTGSLITEFKGHTGKVQMLEWSPNGLFLASASDDGLVILWPIENQMK